jgi:hypothetical protein
MQISREKIEQLYLDVLIQSYGQEKGKAYHEAILHVNFSKNKHIKNYVEYTEKLLSESSSFLKDYLKLIYLKSFFQSAYINTSFYIILILLARPYLPTDIFNMSIVNFMEISILLIIAYPIIKKVIKDMFN